MSETGSTASAPGEWELPSAEELIEMLPQYEIVNLLGRGGMGAVFKGRQAKLDRDVAIKLLFRSAVESDEEMKFSERFQLEAKAMAKLDHPNIVSVHDFGETHDGQLYLVMEFIDGMDIQQYIAHHGGSLPQEHALSITAHVLDALGYAHSHGIVHRDIKPANILLNQEGRVKIADFGLAKKFGGAAGAADPGLTMTNMAVGTPDFVAPEVLEAGREVDHRADLYAVGVMLYQMLVGKVPRGIFKMPSELNPELDQRLDDIIEKAMEADPDYRYLSASDLRVDIDQIISQPISRMEAKQQGEASVKAKPILVVGAAADAESKKKGGAVRKKVEKKVARVAKKKEKKGYVLVGVAIAAVIMIGLVITGKNNKRKTLPSKDAKELELVNSAPQAKKQNKPNEADPGSNPVVLPSPSQLTPAVNSKRIDLLGGIDLNKDVVRGEWEWDGKRLITQDSEPRMRSIRLEDVQIPDEYDLNLRVERLGKRGVNIVFLMSGHQTMLVIEELGWWIETIDGKFSDESAAFGRRVTTPGDKFDARLEVRRDGLAAYYNDEEVFSWKGRPDQLGIGDNWPPQITENDRLFLLANGLFAVDKIELTPINDSAYSTSEPSENSLDMLANIDLRKDVVRGRWVKEGGHLIQPGNDGIVRLADVSEFEEYDLSFQYECRSSLPDKDTRLSLFYSMGGNHGIASFNYAVENKPGWVLGMFDGNWIRATKGGRAEPGKTYAMRLEVRRGRVGIFQGDEELVSWTGSSSQLSIPENLASDDPDYDPGSLYLEAGGEWVVKQLILNPVDQGNNTPTESSSKPVQKSQVFKAEKHSKSKRIDLLSGIDLKKDVISGEWGMKGDVLVRRFSGAKETPGVIRMADVSKIEEYDVEIGLERREPNGFGTNLVFVTEGHQGMIAFSGIAGIGGWFIEDIDGKSAGKSPAHNEGHLIKPGKIHDIRVEVRKGRISCYRDNEEMVSWEGAADRLGLPMYWGKHIKDKNRLYLCSNGPWNIHKIELIPLIDPKTVGNVDLENTVTSPKKPFENSLGMRFVPVPITGGPTDGKDLLFSIWETRIQDLRAFVDDPSSGVSKWDMPEHANKDKQAAGNVSWERAGLFCEWLTAKERSLGVIENNQVYRLPSDHEWSAAVSIGDQEDAKSIPETKSEGIEGVYPWGQGFPPPNGAGNYAGRESEVQIWAKDTGFRDDIMDDFPNVAPVGSFPANEVGIFDLGGNVWEWCLDVKNKEKKNSLFRRVRRGGSYRTRIQDEFLSSYRTSWGQSNSHLEIGFRIVLERLDKVLTKTSEVGGGTVDIPEKATKGRPFENSLGMRFVPVPITGGPTKGERGLFSIWETRVKDYQAFIDKMDRIWDEPDYTQGSEHPAVNVSWNSAVAFCKWLTNEERTKGLIGKNMSYRLPTDHEWSCAVGVGETEDPEADPVDNLSYSGGLIWGGEIFPPSKLWGNFYGDETKSRPEPWDKGRIDGYNDGFERTSPVGSFIANKYGLFDLAGNVWEWCDDLYDSSNSDARVLRGGAWDAHSRGDLSARKRHSFMPIMNKEHGGVARLGFRIVLVDSVDD